MNLLRLKQLYRSVAVISLNTFIVIILINLLLALFFLIQDRQPTAELEPVKIAEDRWESLQKVYPGLSREEIQTLYTEMRSPSRSFIYDPYTEFKERPFRGRYLTEDVNGFRHIKNQGPWPPDKEKYFTVFVFGGSTTFGFGVADDQTVASYLQEFLSDANLGKEVRVYNFGRESYYSTQERILFERLITSGYKPDMAIFINGLNDFYYYDDRPAFADNFEQLFIQKPPPLWQCLKRIPMLRAVREIRRALGLVNDSSPQKSDASITDEKTYNDQAALLNVIRRYTENKRIIDAVGKAQGIRTVAVWQPISLYKYDLKYHLFAGDGFGRHLYAKYGYPLMADAASQNSLGDNFLWCADMQEQATEPLYVDVTHYTGNMARAFAKKIFDMMVSRNLLPGADKGLKNTSPK
ncbi:MAG TPA: SGNH/GDSL hydrolase family protein [Pyrinomonadaceae bacterium]|nr:SGNH/GDSL hydrolase family protein [Pyrinomonadaceae bacterium]